MTNEKFRKIFKETESSWDGDNILKGGLIIQKCIGEMPVFTGVAKDKIYSVDVDDLILCNITKEDVIALRKLNWGIEDDTLYCFV